MFIDELSPIFKQATQHPVSFFGGLFSGVLRLNLTDDPVKTWLDQHISSSGSTTSGLQNGKASGPQQISID
ncbi:hypothetical protein VB713_27995 [Anabaena cylindrica UHCC 0172]|uniref:hypothetical protein n=1 Tax=Anabaena cylindrica TaxID=1165 RepID=UPI002B1F291F|nr:hypothetical protein [Anabaena cylindrica]MEA5554771.1 hypothetical protein [Anabaena cylindrica UHCC 0172]